jgi:CRISPR-associated protein Csd1
VGLLQKACETYDRNEKIVGEYQEGKFPLAPIYHSVKAFDIEITINEKGEFVKANKVAEGDENTIIPVTENSAGRTSTTISAHPLCDQLKYVSPCDDAKYNDYVKKLSSWVDSEYTHPKLKPILKYVQGKTIINDLANNGLIKLNDKGLPTKDDLKIRWIVVGLGENTGACWKDKSLFESFINYHNYEIKDKEKDICMITGDVAVLELNHPKAIVNSCATAKIISSKDDKANFKYRGRFTGETAATQALTIGYIASQKAHNALKWVIENQKREDMIEGQTFDTIACWNPAGKQIKKITCPILARGESSTSPAIYNENLSKAIRGYQQQFKDDTAGIVIAFFGTTIKKSGRLSITYYNELDARDFIERLEMWDKVCCWPDSRGIITSPKLFTIAICAFGTEQGKDKDGKTLLKADDKVLKNEVEKLVSCKLDKTRLPFELKNAIVNKALRSTHYEKENRKKILHATCAVIKKYYYDRGVEISMSLEKDKMDISYQYGRLLAVLEKAEQETYEPGKERETNAIRMQEAFCQRPLATFQIIIKQLKAAYYPKLKLRQRYFEILIEEIVSKISEISGGNDTLLNRPLSDMFVIGYYLQKNEFYKGKNNVENTEEN